jgi:hypothetical protein
LNYFLSQGYFKALGLIRIRFFFRGRIRIRSKWTGSANTGSNAVSWGAICRKLMEGENPDFSYKTQVLDHIQEYLFHERCEPSSFLYHKIPCLNCINFCLPLHLSLLYRKSWVHPGSWRTRVFNQGFSPLL